jgi:Fe-Mn family superoxide dismutase
VIYQEAIMTAAAQVRDSDSETEHVHQLPALPYADDALEPVISAATLALHHGKHQKAYVEQVNRLTKGTEFAQLPLDKLVIRVANDPEHTELFNNAAQAWNHTFYWHSLSAERGVRCPEPLAAHLKSAFGGVAEFQDQFAKAAIAQFGSGWAWLVLDGGKLRILTTGNAHNPLPSGAKPLLTVDVWEHAYYLDYQNRRPEYARAVIETLLNWRFASNNLQLHLK